MSLHKVILNQNEKIYSALDALKTDRKYRQDKVDCGLERVDLYVEDIEGDWLEEWSDNEALPDADRAVVDREPELTPETIDRLRAKITAAK